MYQLDNLTNPHQNPIILNPEKEEILSSARRINVFWFISLALSLSTVMAGIVCLQWIREYERNANVSHREDVALHYMRYQGLKKWQVLKILSALPLLLIAALVLFFAGFIELLWEADQIAAILVAIVVGLAFLFIILTTIFPALQCLRISRDTETQFTQCPYRSPQAWIVLKCASVVPHFIHRLTEKRSKSATGLLARLSDLFRIESWPDIDSFLRRRRELNSTSVRDDGHSLAWVGVTFAQHQEVVEAVSNCLRDLDPLVSLNSCLARMSLDRAVKVQQLLSSPSLASRRADSNKTTILQDLIIWHVLEHLAEKISQTHMSSKLLRQRLELFLKINKEVGVCQEVIDCPVNRDNVYLIPRGTSCELSSQRLSTEIGS